MSDKRPCRNGREAHAAGGGRRRRGRSGMLMKTAPAPMHDAPARGGSQESRAEPRRPPPRGVEALDAGALPMPRATLPDPVLLQGSTSRGPGGVDRACRWSPGWPPDAALLRSSAWATRERKPLPIPIGPGSSPASFAATEPGQHTGDPATGSTPFRDLVEGAGAESRPRVGQSDRDTLGALRRHDDQPRDVPTSRRARGGTVSRARSGVVPVGVLLGGSDRPGSFPRRLPRPTAECEAALGFAHPPPGYSVRIPGTTQRG
jgi:hypothetical protein